ncbi:MAG: pitrilysin family protein [Calditrichia bacterium]
MNLWYKVGSRNEQPGKSGFAHLFEHMMFQGSENVGKAEHMKLISDVGGTVNGSTTQDRTNYWEVVPANQLELALWLEADRMRSLNISRENFENQRDTVKEERRLRVDNQPYMRVVFELKDDLAYSNFAYKHSVIGTMKDLDNADLDDVRQFHAIYYRPNNALLSLVGDFEVRDALTLIHKYFDNIPAGPAVPPLDLAEPPQASEKRSVFEDPFAPFPAYLISFHIPDRTHPDYYALELIERILFDGESSRFYRSLVEEKELALHTFGGGDGKFGPGLFFHFAQIKPGHTVRELEQEVLSQFDRLLNEPVTQAELEKARNKIKSDFISRQETVREISDHLCMYSMLFDDPRLLRTEIDRFLHLTREDLLTVARKYFTHAQRSVIEVYPKNGKSG